MTLIRQMFKYGLVGVANALTAYGVFALLLLLGMHYTGATLLGGGAGMLVGFRLTGLYVFGSREFRRLYRYVFVFALIYFLSIGIQAATRPFVNAYAAGAIAMVLCFFVSFTLNRHFVFCPKRLGGPENFGKEYAAIQIRRSRNPLRRMVRYYYLSDILRHVDGPGIDFGCGAGDLLARMPPGSLGFEINPAAVAYCRDRGLDVLRYDPEADGYELKEVAPGRYSCILFTHVLEHLDNPDQVIRKILAACSRLGIRKMILTQPCEKGFAFDRTHRTYVNMDYMREKSLERCEGFVLSRQYFFPVNVRWLGRFYTFHEWRVIYEREG